MTKFKVTNASPSTTSLGQRMQWVVVSDFGLDDVWTVTVVLNNPPRNTFYDKHVLRKDEDPLEILLLRNSMVPFKQVQDTDATGAPLFFITKKGKKEKKLKEIDNPLWDPERAVIAEGMGIKNTGAPASTVVSLKGMDFNQMMFDFAKACVLAKNGGKFPNKNTQAEFDVIFSKANCVVTVTGAGASSKCRSMTVGGEWIDGAVDEFTFEINHCEHAGPE